MPPQEVKVQNIHVIPLHQSPEVDSHSAWLSHYYRWLISQKVDTRQPKNKRKYSGFEISDIH